MSAELTYQLCLTCWGQGQVIVCCALPTPGRSGNDVGDTAIPCPDCRGTGQVLATD